MIKTLNFSSLFDPHDVTHFGIRSSLRLLHFNIWGIEFSNKNAYCGEYSGFVDIFEVMSTLDYFWVISKF